MGHGIVFFFHNTTIRSDSQTSVFVDFVYQFTNTHRYGGPATSLDYAVSDDPMTGFVYKGIIIDNLGCDPATWNNHGSMECFRGQWYIFYHRSTHASPFSRHVCMEPITIEEDGTIREVKMTTSAGGAIPAGQVMAACRACEVGGNVRLTGDPSSRSGYGLTGIRPGDTATFRYLEFAEAALGFRNKKQLPGESAPNQVLCWCQVRTYWLVFH